MYRVGDLIVYGSTGVCRITGIASLDSQKTKERQFYILNPIFQQGIIYTPIDTKVYMRPVISAEEAESLIKMIPKVKEMAYYDPRKNQFKAHYAEALKSHNYDELIELLKSIYAKKQSERKVGLVEERMMKQAEELLYGELSVALDIPRDMVLDYIISRVKGTAAERVKDNECNA